MHAGIRAPLARATASSDSQPNRDTANPKYDPPKRPVDSLSRESIRREPSRLDKPIVVRKEAPHCANPAPRAAKPLYSGPVQHSLAECIRASSGGIYARLERKLAAFNDLNGRVGHATVFRQALSEFTLGCRDMQCGTDH